MFNFFKKKIRLKDCIPNGYVDIHSHTLFGIDDGAKTASDTDFLLHSMQDLGFDKVITTPHTMLHVYPNTKEIITDKHAEVCELFPTLTKNLSYHASSEYMIDEGFENRIETGELIPLKDKYLLVEMSYINPPIFLDDVIFKLIASGYTPVLAHPERYNFYNGELSAYKHLKKMGCKFQLNMLATVGYYGDKVTKVADQLLHEKMYDFVGSDIHHKKHIEGFNNSLIIKEKDTFTELIKNNLFFK